MSVRACAIRLSFFESGVIEILEKLGLASFIRLPKFRDSENFSFHTMQPTYRT